MSTTREQATSNSEHESVSNCNQSTIDVVATTQENKTSDVLDIEANFTDDLEMSLLLSNEKSHRENNSTSFQKQPSTQENVVTFAPTDHEIEIMPTHEDSEGHENEGNPLMGNMWLDMKHEQQPDKAPISWIILIAIINPAESMVIDNALVYTHTVELSSAEWWYWGSPRLVFECYERCIMERDVMLRLFKLKYDANGACIVLPEAYRVSAIAYLIITFGMAVSAAAVNAGNRRSWLEQTVDFLSVVTIFWLSVFGFIKLAVDDANILRNLALRKEYSRQRIRFMGTLETRRWSKKCSLEKREISCRPVSWTCASRAEC